MILELVSSRPDPVSLADISRSLGLPKSSTLAICRTLEQQDILDHVRDGYTVGLRLVRFASRHFGAIDLAQAFNRVVDSQPTLMDETTQLAVLDGASVMYLARRDGRRPVALASNTGRRLPASTTAAGKALLAWLDEDDVRARFDGLEALQVLTQSSHRYVSALLEDLQLTRERGYAVERGETISGVLCIAAPVWARGESVPRCAVSLTTLDSPGRESDLEELAEVVRSIASDMSDMLSMQ